MKTMLIFAMVTLMAVAVFAAGQSQTTCPVMKGNPVDKSSPYVDVDGYRIYVCCNMCKQAVQADPAKYVDQMKAAGIEIEKAPTEAPKAE